MNFIATTEVTDSGKCLSPRLSVYLPLRQYELTLKHRLLEQLGGFSRLILDALYNLPDNGIDLVEYITGLSQQELEPIHNRLQGLGLINQNGLSPNGLDLVHFDRFLHRKCKRIWLDGRYDYRVDGPSYFGDSTLLVSPIGASQPFVLKNWGNLPWPKLDWHEDCAFQHKRLIDNPLDFLPVIFDDFNFCMAEAKFNINDWDLNVRVVPEFETGFAIEASIKPDAVIIGSNKEKRTHFNFYSPLIGLRTCYKTPKNAPEWLDKEKPADKNKLFSYSGLSINSEIDLQTPESNWIWPEIDNQESNEALEILFSDLNGNKEEFEAFFNRNHIVEAWWQPMNFSWEAAFNALDLTDLHKVNKGEQYK